MATALKPPGADPADAGHEERNVEEKLTPPKGEARGGATGDLSAPSDLELPLRFEIGRRTMTLRELEALAPGAVLPMESDPGAPLTVTCHGKPLARGLLVDLGDGRLGAQLTEGGDAGASQADISQADITQAKPAPKHA